MSRRFVALGGVAGGLALFGWQLFSDKLVPWPPVLQVPVEAPVVAELRARAPDGGVYVVPGRLFVAVAPPGAAGTEGKLVRQLIIDVAAAMVLAFLLARTDIVRLREALPFFGLAALGAALSVLFRYWNWYDFPPRFVVRHTLELLIGWGLVVVVLVPLQRLGLGRPGLGGRA